MSADYKLAVRVEQERGSCFALERRLARAGVEHPDRRGGWFGVGGFLRDGEGERSDSGEASGEAQEAA
jgi:hypothetical protein